MGIFSDIFRFREAGEPVNINNLEEFGEPEYSLFTSTKVFSLHHRIEVTDEQGFVRYNVETKFPSLHDKTYITDAQGDDVAYIHRKLFTLHERHFIDMADGLSFEMATEWWHIIKDIMNIEGLAWQLRGNILRLNFQLYDQNGEIAALISQKAISLHDKYCIDIYQPDYEKVVVAVLITLQHMMSDRQINDALSSGSSSTSDN
ncbi:MAG: hypothetical protein E7185_01015 [Erysipelotrichaceae bacterium]|nr:hypothetical protein [Erysipelotrichaceae bacterium]